MAVDYARVLQDLVRSEVEFILVGGVAGILHGSAKVTFDVDVVYSRTRENIRRLAEALKPLTPYLRGAPPGLPFSWDEETILRGLNFTLTTSLGEVDVLGEVTGGGTYEKLLPHAGEVHAFGVRFFCVGLERLIQLKRAAGRPKDLEAIAELQALLEERRKSAQATPCTGGGHPVGG
jgi:predicted nucleotidyltransferase